MAGRKNQFNLSDKQIEAAAKTGRDKTQKAYAEKADIIAKGYPTSSKKTGASGSSNTGKKNQFSGKRTTGDGATRVDQVMAAAINSTLSAFQKLAADNTSSTGSLSMGESARAAINEAKTAKKEGRQVRPGQAQRKAEQDKIKSFNDGWAGDFKQKLLEGAQKSAESAYESERHAKEGLGKFGQGVVDFGIAGAQFAGDALLNAVAPGAGLAAMAGRAYGSASLDAQQSGLSEGEQQISGLKSAAIEMLTEKLFGSASKVAYGKGIIRNESLVNSLVNRLAKTDRGRTALKVLVGANEEGMEEVLSDILNPIADRILKLDDGKGDWSDLADDFDTQQMLEDYIIGGALGLVGAGTNVVSGQYRAENAQQRAYEEYQRQLVNAGLATEQGGDAQLTAEKYKSIIDQSTQRGKRNLSDKETANLERLMTIGTDTQTVRDMLAQSGVLVDDNTAQAAALAASGQKLSSTQNAAIGNAAVQNAINQMAGNGVVDNIRRTAANEYSKPIVINSMARQYEVAPEVVERIYNLNPTAPQAFETAFDAVYQMGQQGTDKAALGKVPVLSTAQANIAYQMGADSVMSTETTAPVTNNNTQEVNDNGVRIHNVAERINGQNTEGQIRGVETGTGENVAGGSQKEQGGISAAQIKAGEKVSYKGKQQKGVYYAAEDTEDMKKGRKLAESYGYKVTYFVGGNIRYAGGEFRGVVDTAKKTVMVRADHPDYTAEQIMRHEMGHAAFENGDLSIDEAREMLLDEFTADEINELIEIYNSEYGGILSAEEAFEEICCDALGRMNIFEGTDLNSESYGKAQDTVRKYAVERTGSKGRAPPQNGAKWSIEPINSYGGDVSPKSGSLKFSLQENDNITARTMKYYDKHHDDIEHISRAELEQANGIVDEMVDYMTPYLDRTNNKGLRFLPEEILGDTRFDNGSYGKTIENTTICFRTLAYIDFTNDIKEKIGRPLTVEESFLASQMLYDIAKEPQCLYCYVSLDRKAYDAFLLEYIKQRDAVITEYDALGEKEKEAYRKRKDKSNGKKDPLFKKFLGKRKATNNMRDRFNAWITLAENGDSLIGLSDLTTEEKRSQIKSEGGVMADQMYDIEQYAQSASWAKKLEQYRSYNGEILRMSDDLVNTLNSEYGLRFYSFSEYTPAFIVENMQQIRDAALKGFKGLAYTKKPDFARIFAPTGMNINISVFARMDNGKIVPDTLQGADWGEVQELRSQYDNVGAVFVATTDEMVDWALEQDWIDVVIPFHIVRTGANVAEFYKWVNHTSQQADKKRNKNGRPGKKADITPPEHNNDFETYKRLVEKRNLIPRFEKWYGKDNYMKLVNETRRAASETPLLKPNFDENTLSEAIKSFDTFVEDGGYYGGWYEDGTDYRAAVDTVANDILSGKRANEVLYGRQDFDASEAMKHRKERQHGRKFSREPERLNELRRQNERKLAQATAEDAANENERGLIRDYQKQYSKVEGIREKLSAAQQTLTEAEDSGADYDTTTKAKNRFTLLSKQYAREHRKLNGYGSTKALQNVLERVSARTSKDAGHIDNRNFSSVSDRSVKPFQMEHPELHKYYEDMAQTVLYDIGMATQFRTTNGYPKTKFTDEFKRALGGSSFNDGLQALLDISNDQGSENYALAKRMELFLDDLLTNGYKGASGNAEYIRAKENISGGNTAWENYLEENSLAIADGLITEKELYQEFMQMRSDLPEGMGAASANFTGEETVGERWVTEAQGKGDSALHPISKEQEANLAEQQQRAPQEIPKEDLNGKLTSKHVSTIANSGMTPAEFSDALREDAALGKFSHIAYSDEEALKKANRTIEIDGWEQALANYKAEINSGRVSKDNTVMGIALYNNAVNSGDYATAMDIASLMVKNSTNTAQSLQAMRILNKLSPECRLYLAAKSIENIEEDLNERYKDNKADIHVDKILYDEYAKALRQGDEDGIKTAWANIEQSVAQQIDATWYEKLNNFRYLAMLGNPRTHVRNIVGNAFFVPVRAVKNTIAYGLENIADAKINGGIERSKAILNSSNAADAALVKYAMADYEAVQEVILSGGKYVDTFQGIDKHRTIYKTKILEAARKGNSAALDAEDAWFCKPAYANALAKWYKANGITAEQLNTGKVPEETIIKAQTTAIKEAQKATYRDTNWFSAQVSRLGKVDNKVAAMLIEGVLPFKKTPANILARAVEYSPVGLIKSLALDTKKVKAYVNGDVENGMSPAQFIDDISAGLTGSALMGLGILLASWGVLSGGDDDDEKQNYFDELSGKQNYALSIGGMSITLDWLAPESMPLFVGVELFNSLSSKNEDKGFLQNLMSSVMSLSTPMFEMSMLQSVNDLFDNLAYIKQGQGTFKIVSSMAANYISQYFPTLFGQGERAFGETQRETTYVDRNSAVGSELQYMWGKIANKIPFYDFSQIPYIDAWGRTEETGNLFERMLNNFVNPAYVKKERPTEIDGELERLYDLGETSVYPSRAKTNTKINGEYLTADEYVKYATTKGQTSYELAQGVINSAAYSGAADPEKAYMLKYVYSYADHIAKYEVNNDYSLAKWEMAAYKSANPMQAIIDHAREYYNPDKEN